MKIIRAAHLGMCFGVRDAIELALRESSSEPLTILGDLVHNELVLQQLRSQGVRIEHQVAEVRTGRVMITAHGASDRALQKIREQGLEIVQATCPLVHHAHRAILKLVKQGYFPVIIGKHDHVEVRGLTGDLDDFGVVLSQTDVEELPERPSYGIVAQTTQPADRVRHLVWQIEQRFPHSEVRYVDTVCQPTKQRQTAAIDLARHSDVVIVIGGAHSNNTHELARTCAQYCSQVHQVQSARDLRLAWFTGAETVGLTAGTSTPDCTIDEVEQWIQDHAGSELHDAA
ncbi:MAG TPA: 4-hydroxy-3-methylbut-2-enyl diphosphate reductase [Verrucomicrobiae bacterium]